MSFVNLDLKSVNIDDLVWNYCKENNFVIKKLEDEKEYIEQLELFLTEKFEIVLNTEKCKFIHDYEIAIDLREELELISKEDDKFLFNFFSKYVIHFNSQTDINKFLFNFFVFEEYTDFIFAMMNKLSFGYIYNLNNQKVIDFRVPDKLGIFIY